MVSLREASRGLPVLLRGVSAWYLRRSQPNSMGLFGEIDTGQVEVKAHDG